MGYYIYRYEEGRSIWSGPKFTHPEGASLFESGLDAELNVAFQGARDRASVFGRFSCGGESCCVKARNLANDFEGAGCDLPTAVDVVESDRCIHFKLRGPPLPSPAESAMEKHAAWADATSSSGLVLPPDWSVRAAQETGSSENALDEVALTTPLPSMRLPDQVACAVRIAAI
jgi:hypothetical protein